MDGTVLNEAFLPLMVIKRSKKSQNFLIYPRNYLTIYCRCTYRNRDIFITIDRLVIILLSHSTNLYNQIKSTIMENTECMIVKACAPIIDIKVGMLP